MKELFPKSDDMDIRKLVDELTNYAIAIDNYIKNSKSFQKGVYIYNGILTNSTLAEKFNLPYTDIDLLLSVY